MNNKYNTFFNFKRKTALQVALLTVLFYCFVIPQRNGFLVIETPWGKLKALIYSDSYSILTQHAHQITLDTLIINRVLENHSIECIFNDSMLIKTLNAHKNNFRCPSGKIHKKGSLGIVFENRNDTLIPYLYIITGKSYTREILEKQQAKNEKEIIKQCLIFYLESENKKSEIYRLNRYAKSFDTLYSRYKTQTDSIFSLCGKQLKDILKYNDTQVLDYITLGGVPQLDGSRFWLIGEINSGFEIIDRIATTKTDTYFRAGNNYKLALKIVY